MAANYTEEQWQKDLIQKITEFLLSNISFIGVDFIDPSSKFEDPASKGANQVRVLDYACGPGTITHVLHAHATEFVGIDLSENMVKAYNTRFHSKEGDEPINALAVVGDLLVVDDPSPATLSDSRFFNFDLLAVGLGFHHFENLELATERLVERLKPGGVFLIVDFLPHGNDLPRASHHTVSHLGFSEDRVRQIFAGVGLEDTRIVRMNEEVLLRGAMSREPFMARGRKPG